MSIITRSVCFLLACTILLASCSSTTMIESNPSRAKVFIDGQLVGVTPYMHTDSKIVGSSMTVKIEKEGFKPFVSTISKDEEADMGAIIGGVFFFIPYLWLLKYKPVHSYELMQISDENTITVDPQQIPMNATPKAVKLRELKKLLDEKVITQDEFEKEKGKVLEERN